MFKCSCANCNSEAVKFFSVRRRGGRNAGLCAFHAERVESYGTKNSLVVGKPKANGIMIGREFETSYTSEEARIEQIMANAIPTYDSSLHGRKPVEYVYPTECGLNKIAKDAVTVEELIRSGDMEINDSCGTHLHVSTVGTRSENGMSYVRRFYNSIFVPVTEVMQMNREATTALFGRFFTGYAPAINMMTDQNPHNHQNRYVWVNCINSNRIEYRLVKFVNAKQYMTCVKACVEMTKAIDTNFIQHFNDTVTDTNRYPTEKEYRLHKAQVTAGKLVKIFKDACAELGYTVE